MKTPRLTSGYGMRFSRTPQKLTHYSCKAIVSLMIVSCNKVLDRCQNLAGAARAVQGTARPVSWRLSPAAVISTVA